MDKKLEEIFQFKIKQEIIERLGFNEEELLINDEELSKKYMICKLL